MTVGLWSKRRDETGRDGDHGKSLSTAKRCHYAYRGRTDRGARILLSESGIISHPT
jgi:hypothetical protein